MKRRYQAFGLQIESDLCLPELREGRSESPIDLLIEENPSLSAQDSSPERLWYSVEKLGSFLIEEGSRIQYRRDDGDEDTLRLIILGSCLGAVLQQRGLVVLHGNAVSQDGKSVQIIVGDKGAGKSTTAAWHYLKGDKILADDVCAIMSGPDGMPVVLPGYPQLKLWQESASLLGLSTEKLRRVRAEFEKYCLPIGDGFQADPLPVTQVTELSSDACDLSGVMKLTVLVKHSYRHYFLKRMGIESQYHRRLLELAGKIKVSRAPRMTLS